MLNFEFAMNRDLENCIRLLEQILKRERVQKLVVAGLTLLGSLFLTILTYRVAEVRLTSLLAVLSIGTFVVGFVFLIQILKHWQVESHPIVHLLRHDPEQIVWVYAIQVEMMPAGIKFWDEHTFSIHLLNKKEIQLKMKADKIKPLREALQRLLPHATFGYSHERAQWYSANPLLLYNAPEDQSSKNYKN